MKHAVLGPAVTREQLIDWYRQGRARSEKIFSIPVPEAYYERPIPLRNPIVFYQGHIPAFAINTLVKLAFREKGIDEKYEVLFARGIDPESPDAVRDPSDVWPRRECVEEYGRTADARIEQILAEAELVDDSVPELRGGEAVLGILEHEQMHQETLLYMMHNLDYAKKVARPPLETAESARESGSESSRVARPEFIEIPAGTVTLGGDRDVIGFGWDNEFPPMRTQVDGFAIQRTNVTNGEYLEFVESGAPAPYFWAREDGRWFWRGMFERIPLPESWPVYVTWDEADAYARWRGMRLPSEAEYHRAAFGTPSGEERLFPWGNEPPDATRGNFGFRHWDPVPVSSYPAGASAWGVDDLVGNGWEWTSTVFEGYPGFEPMASYSLYSTDFFDGQHYVLKGASPATARELIRSSFRNWFRPNYPYLYATFRCVRPAKA
jgi:formylglycine-generating enzyme required for sulfatase activity